MIGLYFEDKKDKKNIGKYSSIGEASTAAVKYAEKHRLPFEDMHHRRENGIDIYDFGIYGRILVINE